MNRPWPSAGSTGVQLHWRQGKTTTWRSRGRRSDPAPSSESTPSCFASRPLPCSDPASVRLKRARPPRTQRSARRGKPPTAPGTFDSTHAHVSPPAADPAPAQAASGAGGDGMAQRHAGQLHSRAAAMTNLFQEGAKPPSRWGAPPAAGLADQRRATALRRVVVGCGVQALEAGSARPKTSSDAVGGHGAAPASAA